MVTRLKAKDIPEPWFRTRNSRVTAAKRKHPSAEASIAEDAAPEHVVAETRKKDCRKSNKAMVDLKASNRKMKSISLRASTEDFLFGYSKNPSIDVQELRRKREADAIACGRILRTVHDQQQGKRSLASAAVDATDLDSSEEEASAMEFPLCPLSPRSSRLKKAGDGNLMEENVGDFLEDGDAVQHPSKEKVNVDIEEEVNLEEGMSNYINREHVLIGSKIDYELEDADEEDPLPRRSPPARTEVSNDDYHGRQEGRTMSPTSGSAILHGRFYGSIPKSPPRNVSRNSHLEYYKSSQRSVGRSSREPIGGEHHMNGKKAVDYDKAYQITNLQRHEYREHEEVSSRGISHHQGYVLSAGNNDLEDKQKDSEWRCPRLSKQGWTREYSRSPPRRYENTSSTELRHKVEYQQCKGVSARDPSHHRDYVRSAANNDLELSHKESEWRGYRLSRQGWSPEYCRSPSRRHEGTSSRRGTQEHGAPLRNKKDIVDSSPAMERKERRRQQAVRETEKAKREKEGRKPFYLVLDDQGRPYGCGKPAWITEINKLAAGLDPSCTHIRKQTFEGVQTFKDRLHEKFDYSGALNEDHLRGLMGKAVTKRRGELISLIKSGAEQPKNIDKEVWKRLEKLAYSKQREDKSEQGRHANACRKTYGRTGSIGMNGVREKLRLQLNRSPDPEEIEEEMLRDKGYGGQKRRKADLFLESEKRSLDVMLLEQQLGSELGFGEPSKKRAGVACKDLKRRRSGQENNTLLESKNLSGEDYIRELEAENQRLQAQIAKGSMLTTLRPSEGALLAPVNSRD